MFSNRYKLMLQCWSENAEIRPSASELTELLGKPPFHATEPSTDTQLLMVSVQYIKIHCI